MLREVASRDGTTIAYRVTGQPAARPVLLLHGWSANLTCWGVAAAGLARRFRVIAVDLRGHGYSDAPESGYDDPVNWACDVAAVLAQESDNGSAVLLGWSYGGLVLTDYLAVCGTAAVAGVVYVGAINGVGRDVPGGRIGAAMRTAIPDVFAERPARAVRAFAQFSDANTGPGADKGTDAQRLFGLGLSTPPRVRKALFTRTRDNAETLRGIDVPTLIVHGAADPIVDVVVARYTSRTIPGARLSLWDGGKHAPFIEDPARFCAEVVAFVDGL
jgi:pimeloyl-ACP methyl ester carboxylesterase